MANAIATSKYRSDMPEIWRDPLRPWRSTSIATLPDATSAFRAKMSCTVGASVEWSALRLWQRKHLVLRQRCKARIEVLKDTALGFVHVDAIEEPEHINVHRARRQPEM